MHTISKFFTVLIIMMVLIPSTIAAPNEKANPKAGLKIVDLSKGTLKEIKDDKVKGIKSSSSDIVVDEKGKNSIKLKDVNPSKNKNEHKKVKVSLTASELASIDDASKDGVFGVLEIADDGTVIGQRTATTAQLVAGDYFTFSDVEINGFSGYRSETFTGVKSGDTLDVVDVSGNFTMTMSTTGSIPTSVPGIPQESLLVHLPLTENISDVSGNSINTSLVTNTTSPGFSSVYGANIAADQNIRITHDAKFNTSDHSVLLKFYNPAPKSSVENAYFVRQVGKFGIQKFSDSFSTVYDIYTNVSTRTNADKNYLTSTSQSVIALSYNGTGDGTMRYSYNLNRYTQAVSTPKLVNNSNPVSIGQISGKYKDVALYSKVLNTSEYHQYYAGASGISVRPSLYHTFTRYDVASGVEKTISNGGTVTALEYIDTSSAATTRNVTVKTYYTEDTTISIETSSDDFYNASVVFSPSAAMTNGTIVRPIAPLYTGIAVLDSNNTNAVMVQNRTHYTIYTGTLTAGSWAGYNVSVPNNADHGMWLDTIMRWSNTISGWIFGETAPTDYTNDISDEITVTVS